VHEEHIGLISSHLTFLCRHVQHPFLDLGFDCRVLGRRSPMAESTSELDPDDCDFDGLEPNTGPAVGG
jgi:hypothetical protein